MSAYDLSFSVMLCEQRQQYKVIWKCRNRWMTNSSLEGAQEVVGTSKATLPDT